MENWILFYIPGLALIFLVILKLVALISWSWLWILSPGWTVLLLVGALFTGSHLYQCYWETRMKKDSSNKRHPLPE